MFRKVLERSRITTLPGAGIRSLSSRPPAASTGDAKSPARKKVTLLTLAQLHRVRTPIAMMTAHDYPSARFCEAAGVDVVLVGDSLAMVALGHEHTNIVTMDEMLHHCRAVARGACTPFLIGDMPFGSYQGSEEEAVRNAVRFLKEGNMEAIKLEGGQNQAKTVRRIVSTGIPVLGHIGLLPQTQSAQGGYRVQGKTAASASRLVDDARALVDAGCFAIVLEAIPSVVAEYIGREVVSDVPTIGIGAGSTCGGQVLVQHDMLGMFDRFAPKFCKQYADMSSLAVAALEQYAAEVRGRTFPALQHTYPMEEKEFRRFLEMMAEEKKNVTTKSDSFQPSMPLSSIENDAKSSNK